MAAVGWSEERLGMLGEDGRGWVKLREATEVGWGEDARDLVQLGEAREVGWGWELIVILKFTY